MSIPWEIIVDSRATTAHPHDKALETSGDIFTGIPVAPSLSHYKKKNHLQSFAVLKKIAFSQLQDIEEILGICALQRTKICLNLTLMPTLLQNS